MFGGSLVFGSDKIWRIVMVVGRCGVEEKKVISMRKIRFREIRVFMVYFSEC